VLAILWFIPVYLQDRGTRDYNVVVVGHSLGAGTAAILAILLHQQYPNLHCYSYSPPGGLLRYHSITNVKLLSLNLNLIISLHDVFLCCYMYTDSAVIYIYS